MEKMYMLPVKANVARIETDASVATPAKPVKSSANAIGIATARVRQVANCQRKRVVSQSLDTRLQTATTSTNDARNTSGTTRLPPCRPPPKTRALFLVVMGGCSGVFCPAVHDPASRFRWNRIPKPSTKSGPELLMPMGKDALEIPVHKQALNHSATPQGVVHPIRRPGVAVVFLE